MRMLTADILQRSSADKLNIGLFFSSLKSNEEREIYHAKRGDEKAICKINCSHKLRRNCGR